MNEPEIAAKNPHVCELESGAHFWCACGKSAKQPFCDGAHKGSDFRPMKFVLEDGKKIALCQCKRTSNPPYCDGTHGKL